MEKSIHYSSLPLYSSLRGKRGNLLLISLPFLFSSPYISLFLPLTHIIYSFGGVEVEGRWAVSTPFFFANTLSLSTLMDRHGVGCPTWGREPSLPLLPSLSLPLPSLPLSLPLAGTDTKISHLPSLPMETLLFPSPGGELPLSLLTTLVRWGTPCLFSLHPCDCTPSLLPTYSSSHCLCFCLLLLSPLSSVSFSLLPSSSLYLPHTSLSLSPHTCHLPGPFLSSLPGTWASSTSPYADPSYHLCACTAYNFALPTHTFLCPFAHTHFGLLVGLSLHLSSLHILPYLSLLFHTHTHRGSLDLEMETDRRRNRNLPCLFFYYATLPCATTTLLLPLPSLSSLYIYILPF